MKSYRIVQFADLIRSSEPLQKGGPYVGPKGGQYADAAHTIPWSEHGRREQFHREQAKEELKKKDADPKKVHFHLKQASHHKRRASEAAIATGARFEKSAKRPAGRGWRAVGKKGGYVRVRGGKREYWYPDEKASSRPSKAKKKTKAPKKWDPTSRPSHKPTDGAVSRESRPMEPYPSKAAKGSAKWKLETGQFALIKKRVFHRDMDEHQRRQTTWAPNVDNQTKMELIEAYRPLIKKLAKKVSRQLHLPWTNTVMEDLHAAGAEGLLVAIDKYKGGTAFDPTLVTRDMMRVHAAREFIGFEIPTMHARNLARYISARHQASLELEKMELTPEDVVPFFDLRMRHVHMNLPVYNLDKKIGEHPKTIVNEHGKEVPNPKAGEPIYAPLRNAQVPDFEDYELPAFLGHKGKKQSKGGKHEKRRKQPSKYDRAKMYHDFLVGQKGISVFDAEVIAPGAGVGHGLTPEDQVIVREDLQSAAKVISKMGSATIEAKSYPGAKSPTTYRVKDLGDIIMRRLGVDQEEHSIQALVLSVPIEKKTKTGWKRVGDRQAHDLMQKFVDMAADRLPKHTATGAGRQIAERAAKVVSPKKKAKSGPSWHEIIKQESKKFSKSDVDRFRKNYKGPKADELKQLSDAEIRIELAKRSRRGKALSKEIRRLMTQTVEVERIGTNEGIARVFNKDTQKWESVRVRMNRPRASLGPDGRGMQFDGARGHRAGVAVSGEAWTTGPATRIYKSERKALDGFSSEVLRSVANFPNLMRLLTSDTPPSKAKAEIDRLIGLL